MNPKLIMLSNGYVAEVDNVSEKSWHEIFLQFSDANIYQTWAYGALSYGEDNLSHIILKKNNQIIAAAQIRIVRIPIIKAGVAYTLWGPLWRINHGKDDAENFQKIVTAMHHEYVENRGLCLRIVPNEVEEDDKQLQSTLEEAGYNWSESDYRTLYLPLSDSLDVIRTNMSKNWRKNLTKAEKKDLIIVEGTEQDLFEIVAKLYREMLERKGFEPGINIDAYPLIQERLPNHLKMQIMICQSAGQPIAALVGSAIGDVGIELIAATGNDSLDVGASFLLRWKMTEYLKACGCHHYNLNGINPQRNPGGYQFKSGLAGKLGKDLKYLGKFQAEGNWISSSAVKTGETVVAGYKKIIQKITSLQNSSKEIPLEK